MPSIRIALLAIALIAGTCLQVARAGDPPGYLPLPAYLKSAVLDNTVMDGNALQNASGVTSVNMAAGDGNLQANQHAFAAGDNAQATLQRQQVSSGDIDTVVSEASASIGGNALDHGNGIASINQASGNGNVEFNGVASALASPGIREATDSTLSDVASASAGGASPGNPHASGGSRNVSVAPTALQGFQGLLQLNQVAGSGNATGNSLLLAAPLSPH